MKTNEHIRQVREKVVEKESNIERSGQEAHGNAGGAVKTQLRWDNLLSGQPLFVQRVSPYPSSSNCWRFGSSYPLLYSVILYNLHMVINVTGKPKPNGIHVSKTHCLIHSGMATYSIGTSSARVFKLYTYLTFWENLELQKEIEMAQYKYFCLNHFNFPNIYTRNIPYEGFCECQQGTNEPGGVDNYQRF